MNDTPVFVPDASVILKWVLESKDENDRERALELRQIWLSGNCVIMLPSLWFYEVGNILGTKQRDLAPQLMEILTGYRFDEQRPETIYETTLGLMKKYGVTFYDAAYHAVAIHHSGLMITADDAYYRKTSKAGHVAALRNWSPTLGSA